MGQEEEGAGKGRRSGSPFHWTGSQHLPYVYNGGAKVAVLGSFAGVHAVEKKGAAGNASREPGKQTPTFHWLLLSQQAGTGLAFRIIERDFVRWNRDPEMHKALECNSFIRSMEVDVIHNRFEYNENCP